MSFSGRIPFNVWDNMLGSESAIPAACVPPSMRRSPPIPPQGESSARGWGNRVLVWGKGGVWDLMAFILYAFYMK